MLAGSLLLWKKILKQFQGWNILYFLLHRFPSQPPFSYDQEHSSSFYFSPPFPFSPFLSKQHGETLQGFWFLLLLCHCHIILTDTEKPQLPDACEILSFFFSLSLILVLRQEHSSGVEGSQPARGNLCCMGKTPWGSLHICSVVAQGHDRAN